MGQRSPSARKPEEEHVQGKKPAPRELLVKVSTGRGKARKVRTGTAVILDDELRFRTGRHGREGADFSLHIAFAEIARIEMSSNAAIMTLTTDDGDIHAFHVGKHGPAWKEMLETRKHRLEEFGVSPRSRVAIIGVGDLELVDEITAFVPLASELGDDAVNLDVAFVGVEHLADLARLGKVARRLGPSGVMWVVHPGEHTQLSARAIATAANGAGLSDGVRARISRTHDAIRIWRGQRDDDPAM